MLFVTHNIDLRKRFIVYGAHSKKPTHAYFKPIKSGTQTNWLQKRQELERKNKPKPKPKTKLKTKPKRNIPLQKKITPAKKQTIIRKEKKTQSAKKPTSKIKPLPQKEKPLEEEELHFNVLDKYDPALAKYHRHIQKEVERIWRPPIGVPKGTECSILFHVDKKGNVKHFEVKQRSQVLIYDLSVIRIAKNFHFDTCLWNKKFTIDFRQ
jgi:hypothetical protein